MCGLSSPRVPSFHIWYVQHASTAVRRRRLRFCACTRTDQHYSVHIARPGGWAQSTQSSKRPQEEEERDTRATSPFQAPPPPPPSFSPCRASQGTKHSQAKPLAVVPPPPPYRVACPVLPRWETFASSWREGSPTRTLPPETRKPRGRHCPHPPVQARPTAAAARSRPGTAERLERAAAATGAALLPLRFPLPRTEARRRFRTSSRRNRNSNSSRGGRRPLR